MSSARSYDQTWLTAYQAIPRCLNGDTVWVIGGGPSLRNFDPGCLEGREVIVTNEAFALVPTALALVFVDVGWYQRRKTEIRNRFKGKFIIGRGNYRKIYATDGCVNVAYRSGMQWSENPKILGGKNSGLAAVNAAWLMGAARAILLGFDMRPMVDADGTQRNNYHSLHPQSGVPNYTHRYAHLFLPEFHQAAVSMEQHGFVVINATPGSALKCFPERTLEWCLDRYPVGTAKGVPAVA